MTRLDVPRMLTVGSLVSSATAVRIVVGYSGLLLERAPQLAQLGVAASVAGNVRAQCAFRDDLLSLARDTTDLSWRELRRALDDFDSATRPAANSAARPSRPHRVKP